MDDALRYADVVRSRLRSATPMASLAEVVHALHLTTRTRQRRLDEEAPVFLLCSLKYAGSVRWRSWHAVTWTIAPSP